MSRSTLKTAALVVAVLSTLAAPVRAADLPARVGRIALTQGQVVIGADVGAEMEAAQVNWPVTGGNTVATAAGARTEIRIGSTSIRLDGDSSLEVVALDDSALRLRLHYGSANVRVRNPDLVAGFELATPQARVLLQQPALLRVDAERVRDTSSVEVFDGVALVDGGGSQLTLRAGKGADIGEDDVRTLAALPDAFDDWSAQRDRLESRAAAARYVDTEMTGYEDLDRYGSWRVDNDYGPLWTPAVAAGWVPYRDGSWTWLDPWGWTWVDNAPWGYAPFHYGRWVQVDSRWAWAPGRRPPGVRRDYPVWSPALVGWVGGAGWNVTFRDRSHGPGLGWYPLSPHERFVPGYRLSDERLRWLNGQVRPDAHPDPRRGRDYRPQGLTVVPQDRFGRPGRVNVSRAPISTAPPALAQNLLAGVPPPAPNRPQREARPARAEVAGRPDGIGRPGREGGLGSLAERAAAGAVERSAIERRGDDRRGIDIRDGNGRRIDSAGVERQGGASGIDIRDSAGRRVDGRSIESGRIDSGGIDRRGDDRRHIGTDGIERDGFAGRRAPGSTPAGAAAQAGGNPAQGLTITSPPPRQSPQPGTIVSPPPQQSPQPVTIVSPPPHQPLTGAASGAAMPLPAQGWSRDERREQFDELRRNRRAQAAQAPLSAAAPLQAVPEARVERAEQRTEARLERGERGERGNRGGGERPAGVPAPRAAPPAAIAAPAPTAMPGPSPAAARPAAPTPAQRAEGGQRQHVDGHGRQQQER